MFGQKRRSASSVAGEATTLGSVFENAPADGPAHAEAALPDPDAFVSADPETSPKIGGEALTELARLAPERSVPHDLRAAFEGGVTPLALIWAGGQLGLDLVEHTGGLAALEAADPPCLVVFEDGTALVVTGSSGRKRFAVSREDGPTFLSRDEILAASPAAIFIVRPLDGGTEAAATQPRSIAMEAVVHVLRRRRGPLMQLLAASAACNLLLLALPVFSMAVYDRVLPHLAMETLWAVALGVSVALAADLALRLVRLSLSDAVGASAAVHLQTLFFRRLMFSAPAAAPKRAGVLTHALRELDQFCHALPAGLTAALVDLPFVVVLLLVLAAISPSVALVAAAGAVIIVVLQVGAQALSDHRMLPVSEKAQQQANMLVEGVEALRSAKLLGLEPRLLARWERLADGLAYDAHRARFWSGFSSQVAMFGSQMITVAVMIAAVHDIALSAMTVGALAAATILVNRIVAPLAQIVMSFQRLRKTGPALGPVRAVLAAPEEAGADSSPAAERPFRGHIRFEGLELRHPGAPAPVLHGISLSIAPGERVALIGRIGSGKSTLLRLLARLAEPTAGSVAFDGVDARLWNPRALRRKIGLLTQETPLFDDTLHANLVLARPDVEAAGFDRVVRITGVHDIAARQADGYATKTGPRGENLSGGERQAVALARTLMAEPPLLLLDEPTSAMDNGFETQIIQGLKEWPGPPGGVLGPDAELRKRTLIVATHRLAVLDLAERIIWLDGGRVIADGPKSEILARMAAK